MMHRAHESFILLYCERNRTHNMNNEVAKPGRLLKLLGGNGNLHAGLGEIAGLEVLNCIKCRTGTQRREQKLRRRHAGIFSAIVLGLIAKDSMRTRLDAELHIVQLRDFHFHHCSPLSLEERHGRSYSLQNEGSFFRLCHNQHAQIFPRKDGAQSRRNSRVTGVSRERQRSMAVRRSRRNATHAGHDSICTRIWSHVRGSTLPSRYSERLANRSRHSVGRCTPFDRPTLGLVAMDWALYEDSEVPLSI